MTKEEAIKEIKSWDFLEGKEIEAIHTLIPELAESEDERIRKEIIEYFKHYSGGDNISVRFPKWIAYLEKQKAKERLDRMAPIYNDKESFESALEKAWKYYNESASRKVDSFEDDYIECVFSKGFREGFLYREKQKEQEHNEGDFTIYHPLKNGKGEYECIPYSFYGLLASFSEDKDLIDFLRTCFYTEEECNEWIKQQKEQKPAEWSEEDEKRIKQLIYDTEFIKAHYEKRKEELGEQFNNALISDCDEQIAWLKSFPKRFNLQSKHGWRHYIWAVNLRFDYDGLVRYEDNGSYEIVTAGDKPKRQVNGEYILLKDIQLTDWKPSEEQMEALDDAIIFDKTVFRRKKLVSLLKDLKKLM